MQNRTGETRAVVIQDSDQPGPNYIRFLELSAVIVLFIVFSSGLLKFHIIFTSIVWYLALIFALSYVTLKTLFWSGRSDIFFLILFPVTIVSLWRFGIESSMELSPLVLVTVAILYYCYPVKQASIAFLILWISIGVTAVLMQDHLSIFLWLPVFGIVWGIMFWHLRREREWFRTRFLNFQNKAMGFISGTNPGQQSAEVLLLDKEMQVAKAAASVHRFETLVQQIIDLLHAILHPNSTYFFSLDPVSGFYKVTSFKSRSRFFDSETLIEHDEKGLLAWIIQNKQPMRYERLPKASQYPNYYNPRERILSCLLYPIVRNGIVDGILGVDSHRSYAFTVDEEAILKMGTDLIGHVMEFYRIYQNKDTQADRSGIFYTATKKLLEAKLDTNKRSQLLIELSQMLKKSDEAAVAVVDEKKHFIIRRASGTSFSKLIGARIHPMSAIGETVSQTRDVTILDPVSVKPEHQGILTPAESGIRIESAMIIPLPQEDTIIGVLILCSKKRNYYTDDERYIFSSLAAQFGFSLENALNVQKIQELAVTDGLTGAYNHRYFQDALSREIKRSKRDESPVSLLMIDIDHFKKFNDTYGHQAGDEVLKAIARLLKDQAREIDIVARYGGEEFAALLVKCDLKSAQQIADRIRKTCAKSTVSIGGEKLSVTMSIGVSNLPEHTSNPADLIACADKALYKAKETGRNRVVIYQVETPAA